MSSRHVVITSIFPPTAAVHAFARIPGHEVTVVGDRKTPAGWACDGVTFISVAQQNAGGYALAEGLPYDHYGRKMFGYLRAIEQGATVIIDSDDDNIPKAGWEFPDFDGVFECLPGDLGFVNVYELYTEQKIWPRGLPLRYVNSRTLTGAPSRPEPARVGIWQGLADGDPDVDAIYRLTTNAPCVFRAAAPPYVLGRGTLTPWNSQNTAVRRELFALLYLPVFVSFRFTDILRGLVAQPILWRHGFRVGVLGATVTQERNPHDYMKDFESEVPMYLFADRITDIVGAAIGATGSVADHLFEAYAALHAAGIVQAAEMDGVSAWLKDVNRCAGASAHA